MRLLDDDPTLNNRLLIVLITSCYYSFSLLQSIIVSDIYKCFAWKCSLYKEWEWNGKVYRHKLKIMRSVSKHIYMIVVNIVMYETSKFFW